MDEKQAIARIRKLLDSPLRETSLSPRTVKALEYAIEALKKQAAEVPPEKLPVRHAERFSVGGIDRSGDVDRIDIQVAMETPFWMTLWETEPERKVDVRMSYSDLKVLLVCFENVRKFLRKGKDDGEA